VCVASEPTKVLFIPLKRPDWMRNGAFRKRDASSENSLQSDMKSGARSKEKRQSGLGENTTEWDSVWRRGVGACGCHRRITSRIDYIRFHSDSHFKLPTAMALRDMTRRRSRPSRKRKRGSNIQHTYPPLLRDWYWMRNTFWWNAICEIQRVHPVDSIRILRYYEYTISRTTARFQALILLANTHTKITV